MTLNLMFTSRHATYLTGDFRLTRPGGYEDDLFAQKIVPVIKYEWCALVSYCGVARTSRGIDVGDWIAEQTNPEVPREKFDDFVGRLRSADRWLSPLRGNNSLTITMSGFHGRKPFVACLSNFQDIEGRWLPKLLPQLKLFELRPKDPEIRVFGDPASVPEPERRALRENLSRNVPANEAPAILADANKAAATRSKSISKECVVGQVRPTGAGSIRPYGIDPNVEYMPNFIKRFLLEAGVEKMRQKTNDRGEPLPPAWVQMGFSIRGTGKKAMIAKLLEMHNVEQPFLRELAPGAQADHETTVFWKIAQGGEKEITIHLKKKSDGP